MAQADGVVSNASGAAVRADLNNQLAAVFTNHSGATEPTTTYAYQWWADTTTGLLKIRNAANSAWVTVGTLADVNLGLLAASGGTLTGALLAAAGSASTPSIAFSGDTNTGIYSPGSDQVAISTGGTQRLAVDSSGNITIDTNTLYVDAANNRVGIGSSSPGATLDVVGNARAQGSGAGGGIFDAVYSGTSTGNQLGAVRFYGTGAGVTAESQIRSSLDSGVLTASNLTFSVSSGGNLVEAARLDSSRRLLVGTSTSIDSDSIIQIKGRPTGTGSVLPSFIGGNTSDLVAGNSLCYLNFYDGFRNGRGAYIGVEADASWGANDFPTRLVFSTCPDSGSSPVERLRITNAGYLKCSNNGSYVSSTATYHEINQSLSGSPSLIVYASSNSYTSEVVYAATNTAAGNGWYLYTGRNSAALCYGVFGNGNVVNTNNSYGAISDLKLKENIVDANSQWDDIKALQVRNYNFKEGQTHTQIGLVAQEVELVSPGLVSESPDRDEDGNDLGTVTKSVNYSVLYMKAVKALQEAMERIEQLESEMAAVKAQLA